MEEKKKSFVRTGLFHIICAILCSTAATVFAFVMTMMMMSRYAGFHWMDREEMFKLAYDRISENNMAIMFNDLSVGYNTTDEALAEDPEGEMAALKDHWNKVINEYFVVKNVDFAVILSEKEDLGKIDLKDEDVYFYRSERYSGYDNYLSGQLFYTNYWTESQSYRLLMRDYPLWTGVNRSIVPGGAPYYIHILYRTADTFTVNPANSYDNMYFDSNIVSFLNCLYETDRIGDPLAAAALVLTLFFMVMFFISAGYRGGKEGIYISFVDRIPLFILIVVNMCIEYVLIYALYIAAKLFARDAGMYMSFGELVFVSAAITFVMILIAGGFLGTVAVRIKSKTLWKSTLLYRIKDFITGWISRMAMWAARHVPMALIVIIALPCVGVVSLVEAALIQDGSNTLAALFVLGRLAGILLTLYLIWGYYRLRDGAKRIAAGKLDEPVDDKHLIAGYKLFAEDLNGVGQSIQLAVEDRMKSEHMKTQLITNVSHDIKTPLTSIINYVDLLQKEDASEDEKKEYLDILAHQSARLKKLIQDLIEASKASSGALEVELTETDMCTMAKQVAGEYHDKYEAAGLNVVMRNMDEERPVNADNNLLWRVMDNLFANTLKYAMPGTRVYLETGECEGKVFFSIINISKEELGVSEEELMERFVRGDVSRNTEGSGLGLSIARSLMELMGGNLSIKIEGDSFKAVIELKKSRTEP